jgi:triacylglycerol lipase
MRGIVRGARVILAALLLLGCFSAVASASASEPLPPQGASPPGANDFTCKPPARHPYPIVLVHGTILNMQVSWNVVAPALERLGYCVFALDYGNSPLTGVNGVGDIPKSARQLATFVGKVRSATHAAKVSIVGHSQGGMMPRYLIKFLGGAGKIDDLVGLSPSTHGTTNPLAPNAAATCPACVQQVAGSSFMKHLNAGDQTPPPVSYTVIETRNDEVVTPYQSEFLPTAGTHGRVTNVLLQDRCPTDSTDHIAITNDPVAVQYALRALGRPGPLDSGFRPDCSGAALATFPDSSSVSRGRLGIAHIGGSASRTADRRLRVRVFSNRSGLHGVVVTIHTDTSHGPTLGRSSAFSVSSSRVVTVALDHPLHARGRYVAVAVGRDSAGHRIGAARYFGLRR